MTNPVTGGSSSNGLLANIDGSMLVHAGAVVLVVLILYHFMFHR